MHWNHRVIRMPDGEGSINIICEVYYNEDGTPKMHNDGARVMFSETENAQAVLECMKAALEFPVLTPEDFAPEKHPIDWDEDQQRMVDLTGKVLTKEEAEGWMHALEKHIDSLDPDLPVGKE